jgi:hypothetical protein
MADHVDYAALAHRSALDEVGVVTTKPHFVVRAEVSVAPTLWVCQSVGATETYYRAASSIAKLTGRLNTIKLCNAARFPNRQAADQARGMDHVDAPTDEDSETKSTIMLLRWHSAEAPPAQYECVPEMECPECHGTSGARSVYGHARLDCTLLNKASREAATARKTVTT